MPIDPSIVDPSTLASIKQTFWTSQRSEVHQRRHGLFSSLLQHGFGELGTGPRTAQGFVQRNKTTPFGATPLRCTSQR